jgi:hypothetical protein
MISDDEAGFNDASMPDNSPNTVVPVEDEMPVTDDPYMRYVSSSDDEAPQSATDDDLGLEMDVAEPKEDSCPKFKLVRLAPSPLGNKRA